MSAFNGCVVRKKRKRDNGKVKTIVLPNTFK